PLIGSSSWESKSLSKVRTPRLGATSLGISRAALDLHPVGGTFQQASGLKESSYFRRMFSAEMSA
ncbi:hypothetical protein, partial [Sinorhizobium meliloti]|uniref:hypothetical protein n=1 Tax=Rhizobium meliloti TaxID=382 RepID=UPI001AEBA90C